jgi:hypothetical protein
LELTKSAKEEALAGPLLASSFAFLKSGFGTLLSITSDLELIYYTVFWILALLGIIQHPFYITFHLSIIIIRSSIIQNLLNAIFSVLGKIILTLVICLIVVYWFTIWSYASKMADSYPDGTCNSLFKCFLVTFDQTFKNNGGIGPYTDGTKKAYGESSGTHSVHVDSH